MIVIEMVNQFEEVNPANGRSFILQTGYVFTLDKEGQPKKYPEEIKIYRPSKAEMYPEGKYSLTADAVQVADYKLVVRPKLRVVKTN